MTLTFNFKLNFKDLNLYHFKVYFKINVNVQPSVLQIFATQYPSSSIYINLHLMPFSTKVHNISSNSDIHLHWHLLFSINKILHNSMQHILQDLDQSTSQPTSQPTNTTKQTEYMYYWAPTTEQTSPNTSATLTTKHNRLNTSHL